MGTTVEAGVKHRYRDLRILRARHSCIPAQPPLLRILRARHSCIPAQHRNALKIRP
jgi:hypothetical protein